ncbi:MULTISPECIES: hypothetical protein [unclassified Streptomyces]|uniref:hypothetical protein n=1 Tax=unclassified Streptomyces TaxID=2593676 RepID=UPI0013DBD26D|nr:hypothetical protein [Streptomyces sp. OM5714]KAF2777252.1 2-polyprenyl-6-methoxyphenol 4-hydroxylase [Streptomyces sp. OM5714]
MKIVIAGAGIGGAGTELTELSYHNHLGQRIWYEPRDRASDCDWRQLAVHRGVLQSILVDAVHDRLLAAFTQSCLDGYRLEDLPGGGGHLDALR